MSEPEWVSRSKMREFLDRLKWPGHPDYDTILEIEEQLEEGFDAQDGETEAEEQAKALHELCVEAGILDAGDHETDPLPLLKMFLPVE